MHMGELRLYAIGVDEVRDVFCASPELAAEFRRIVADEFPPQTTPKAPGMLGKLGPLFRKPAGAVLVRPDTPVESDVADLLAGVKLHDEPTPLAALACRKLDDCRIEIVLDQGKYHQVKRMLAAAGNHCAALTRSAIGGLELTSLDLAEGEWRYLSETELALLNGL